MARKIAVKKDEHRQSIYWKYFTEEQRRALENTNKNDLNGEINLLRVLMTRFIKQELKELPKEEGQNPSSLKLKGLASLTLGALQKIQVSESVKHPTWEALLEEGRQQAREEMGILDYLEKLEPKEESEDE